MIGKWFIVAIGSVTGMVLGFAIFNHYAFIDRVTKFESKGERFTAHDGQVLYERIKALELLSYGYRDSYLISTNCTYGSK